MCSPPAAASTRKRPSKCPWVWLDQFPSNPLSALDVVMMGRTAYPPLGRRPGPEDDVISTVDNLCFINQYSNTFEAGPSKPWSPRRA